MENKGMLTSSRQPKKEQKNYLELEMVKKQKE